MDPALAAKLAARRSKSEPEVVTVPTESITVDASDLERLLIEEREKNSAVLARICNTMLHAESADPDVYPLQDDSRFLMHTLLSELDDIKGRSPSFAVEVGCGAAPSGVLLSRLLPSTVVLGADISASAMRAARHNASINKAALPLARMDLLSGLRPGIVDLIVFLPPYVATTAEKLADAIASVALRNVTDAPARNFLEATWLWAGGPNGMAVVERFVATDLPRVLSAHGVAYVLFSQAAESVEMIERVSNGALSATVVARCTDPALGDKGRICIVRVERCE